MIPQLVIALIGLVTLLQQAVALDCTRFEGTSRTVGKLPQRANVRGTNENLHHMDTDSHLSDKRACFDQAIAEWMHDNPSSFQGHSTVRIEQLWGQIISTAQHGTPKKTSSNRLMTALRRRMTASAAEISSARAIVDKLPVQAKISQSDLSPKRNNYSLRPATSVVANKTEAEDVTDSFSSLDKSGKARALIAEVEAEKLDQQGKLFGEYKIAHKTENGDIEYKTHQAPRSESALQARQGSSYWLARLGGQNPGKPPFGANNRDYKVFRNVKDYGARGNGRTDDTEAINRAISDGDRFGESCGGSTVKSATVYFLRALI